MGITKVVSFGQMAHDWITQIGNTILDQEEYRSLSNLVSLLNLVTDLLGVGAIQIAQINILTFVESLMVSGIPTLLKK